MGLLDFFSRMQRAYFDLPRRWGLVLLGIAICLLLFVYWYKENFQYLPSMPVYAGVCGFLGGIGIALIAGGLAKLFMKFD